MRASGVACLVAAFVLLGAAHATQTHRWHDFEADSSAIAPVASLAGQRLLLQETGAYGGARRLSQAGGYGGARRLFQEGGYGGRSLLQEAGAYGGARRLLQLLESQEDGYSSGRSLLQASGAYGGARRLFQEGGYGGRSLLQEAGYGSSTTRALLELEEAEEEAEEMVLLYLRKQQEQEEARLASASAAEERRAQLQREAEAADGDAAVEGESAALAAALRGGHAAAVSSELSPPEGQCYCRYDSDYNTWALAEEPCKAALLAKCRAGQLPCDWLEAYYGHMAGGNAHTLPHEQDILGFVFDDCQPHAPCACAGVKFDGSDSVSSAFACCRDLRAACRTPFNGLACADVEGFCSDDATSSKLLHWAQHKLHRGVECSAYAGVPYDFVTLESIVEANRAAAGGDDDTEALAAAEEPAAGAAPARRPRRCSAACRSSPSTTAAAAASPSCTR